MKKKRFISPLLVVTVMSLFSCINNDYDLSDIDSTIGVNVKDLTVPINISEVTLDAMLDVDEGSQIQKVNGEYAVVESGTFHSEQINIPSFTITNLGIEPIEDKIEVDGLAGLPSNSGMKNRAGEANPLFFYKISNAQTNIHLHEDAKGVSDFIVAIKEVGVSDGKGQKAEMKVTLGFSGLENFVKELEIENLKLQFLPGLIGTFSVGEYDKKTGVLNIGNIKTTGHKLELSIQVSSIDSDAGYEFKDGSFSLDKTCYVSDGRIAVYERNLTEGYWNNGSLDLLKLLNDCPREIGYSCRPEISDISVTNFTGRVKYDIGGININPVELNDIPDVLSQTGTKIRLDNPQIYLQLNNPVYAKYGLTAEANLKITSYIGGVPFSFSPDNGGVTIKKTDNKFCLSPKVPEMLYKGDVEDNNGETVYVDFTEGTDMVSFTRLSDVLCGEKDIESANSKLPEKIEIDVVDSKVVEQDVKDFKLGENIGSVNGEWVFYAPLSLTGDSRIKYTDAIDGWNDEDVDAIVISKLVINAEVTTDIPLDLDITAYPIDKNGKKIMGAEGKPVSGTATVLHTSSKTPLTIEVVGEIKHLDGIILDAYVKGTDENLSLKPVQAIKLDNVRAKVSGTYEKEL